MAAGSGKKTGAFILLYLLFIYLLSPYDYWGGTNMVLLFYVGVYVMYMHMH